MNGGRGGAGGQGAAVNGGQGGAGGQATNGAVPVVAAMDCGTNSFRLLIAQAQRDGQGQAQLVPLHRDMQIVRLGQGVDRTGRLDSHAIARGVRTCEQFAAACQEFGVQTGLMVATSAMRDAANSQRFLDQAQRILGFPAQVITGRQEARLSFAGALLAVPEQAPGPFAVLDIGGGSTEVVVGLSGDASTVQAASMDVGAVRLTERHFRSDPPTASQVASARADVAQALDHLAGQGVQLGSARTALGVAGTITTVAAHVLNLPAYDSAAIHGLRLSAQQIAQACAQYVAADADQRHAQPYLHPGRADVIAAGALILDEVVRFAGWAQLIVSETDILDGTALELAAQLR